MGFVSNERAASRAIARAITVITAARGETSGDDVAELIQTMFKGSTDLELYEVIMALARIAAVSVPPERLYSLAADVNLRLAKLGDDA